MALNFMELNSNKLVILMIGSKNISSKIMSSTSPLVQEGNPVAVLCDLFEYHKLNLYHHVFYGSSIIAQIRTKF